MLNFWFTIVIIIAISVGISFIVEKYSWRDYGESFRIVVIITALCFLFLWLFGMAASDGDTKVIDERYYTAKKHELKSLMNTSEIKSSTNGGFVMGFGFGYGSVNQTEETKNYYYTLVNYEGIGSKIEKYDTSISYISEEDITTPYIEYINYKYKKITKPNFINGGIFKEFDSEPLVVNRLDKYILHVPKNTVKVQWDVNLANVK